MADEKRAAALAQAKEIVGEGVALFKKRDWDGSGFNLPGGLLSSIWEKVADALQRERGEETHGG